MKNNIISLVKVDKKTYKDHMKEIEKVLDEYGDTKINNILMIIEQADGMDVHIGTNFEDVTRTIGVLEQVKISLYNLIAIGDER